MFHAISETDHEFKKLTGGSTRSIFESDLLDLSRRDRLRSLKSRTGIDFTSNDYLGLAESRELSLATAAALLRGVPFGSGGSRLLRGNHPEHEALEAESAQFFGAEAALYFDSGYMANFAVFSTLPQRGDLVVHDALIHASVHEGVRRGRAESVGVPHNDILAFDEAIFRWRKGGGKGTPWLSVESLYSMDGDSPNLDELFAVADRHDAMVVIDEAHATGIYGHGGRGLAHAFEGRENLVTLHTCGKALGTSGGLVLSSKVIRDFLVNRARPFIFSTAPSPIVAAVTRAAIQLVGSDSFRRHRLAQLVRITSVELKRRCGLLASGSQIVPIVVGSDQSAVTIASALQNCGFDIRPIRPPTVPEGSARLRIALSLNVDETQIGALLDVLSKELGKLRK
jgi:8-amino-7-oxononanoate synthase